MQGLILNKGKLQYLQKQPVHIAEYIYGRDTSLQEIGEKGWWWEVKESIEIYI